MRHTKKLPARIARFESLETRNLLAGNVTTDIQSGTLVISGDNAANAILVTQVAPTTYKVTGIGTKLNGSNSPQTFPDITNGLDLEMGGGNDSVTLKNLNLSTLNVYLDAGNDALVMSGVTVSDDLTYIEGSTGSNAVSISNCKFESGLKLLDEGGNDALAMSGSQVMGGMLLELGDGTNALTMVNDTISGEGLQPFVQPLTDGYTTPDCGAVIIGGSGTDVIVMNNVHIDCFTQIDTSGGADSVVIANSRFGNLVTDPTQNSNVVEPSLDDTVLVDPSLNDTYIGLYIQTGLGNDAVAIANTTVYGHLHIDSSDELFPEGYAGYTTPYTIKDGNDSVALNKVNVLDDGGDANPYPYLDTGELWIRTGSQSDAVVVNGVVTDGDAAIYTSDLSFDQSTVDGADSVAIANSTFGRLDPALLQFGIDRFSGDFYYGLAVDTGNGNDVVSIVNVKVTEATVVETGNGSDHVAISGLTETPNPAYYAEIYIDVQGGKYNTLTITNSSSNYAEFYVDDNTGSTLVKVHNHFNIETDGGFDHVID